MSEYFEDFFVSADDRTEFIGQIIDLFEDFLELRGVWIENPERVGEPGEAIIYGTDYGELQIGIAETLDNWGVGNRNENYKVRCDHCHH